MGEKGAKGGNQNTTKKTTNEAYFPLGNGPTER